MGRWRFNAKVIGKRDAIAFHEKMNLTATARASIGIYNTKDDLDKLNEGINNCKKIFDLK